MIGFAIVSEEWNGMEWNGRHNHVLTLLFMTSLNLNCKLCVCVCVQSSKGTFSDLTSKHCYNHSNLSLYLETVQRAKTADN